AHIGTGGIITSSAIDLASSDVTGILSITNGGSPFEQANGAIFERLPTQDVLFGGVSTTSAKFGFLNNAGGTPTASISGASNNALSLTATGNISTTNSQTLNLGGASTGNIVLDSGSGLISLLDNTTVNGNLSVTGNTTLGDSNLDSVTVNASTLSLVNASSLDLIDNNISALSIEGGLLHFDTSTSRIGIGTVNHLEKLDVVGSATVSGNLTLYGAARNIQTTERQTLTIGGSTTGDVVLSG